jgi:hypothetical protein
VATLHPLAALLTFVSGGIACLLSAKVQGTPCRYLSIFLGAVTLAALAVALAGDATVLWEELGSGGVERWVAYPIVLWEVAFGGYLMAGTPVPSGIAER